MLNDTDRILTIVVYATIALTMLVALLLTFTYVFRFREHRQYQLEQELRERWLPVLFDRVSLKENELGRSPPVFKKSEKYMIALCWIQVFEQVRGRSEKRLRKLANDIGLVGMLRHKINGSKNLQHRTIAIQTCGYMRDKLATSDLHSACNDSHTVVSLCALRALMLIDSSQGMHALTHWPRDRYWPKERLALILRELPTAEILPKLYQAVLENDDEFAAKLLILTDSIAPVTDEEVIFQVSQRDSLSTSLIQAILQVANSPLLLPFARHHMNSSEREIRAAAVRLLGAIGNSEDLARLEAALGDADWWVRYQAGQAVIQFPSVDLAHLQHLLSQHPDRFARDILRHVLGEQQQGVQPA